MKLVWKLLRKHISIPQMAGYVMANLVGMAIVLLAWQFYHDVKPVFTANDTFLKADYVVVAKKVAAGAMLSQRDNGFSAEETEELRSQDFVERVGAFRAADYSVYADMMIDGKKMFGSEFFFESLPDEFVGVDPQLWHYDEGQSSVPVILPRAYINMYNMGFARSHGAPVISDGMMGMILIDMHVKGREEAHFTGQVVGFTSRMNAILVPEAFLTLTNARYGVGKEPLPSRLVVEPRQAADDRLSTYVEDKGYEVAPEDMDAGKTAFFLRLLVGVVIVIGLLISALSFYVLMLSIYLLVQKNAEKMRNLQLIGYTRSQVARPYQWLSVALLAGVTLLSIAVVAVVRHYYIASLERIFPQLPEGSLLPAITLGFALFVVVGVVNFFMIARKVCSGEE